RLAAHDPRTEGGRRGGRGEIPVKKVGVGGGGGWGGSGGSGQSMKIVSANDKRAIARLLAPAERDDRAFERRVRAIVEAVRAGGDRALERFARRFDDVATPLEVTDAEMRTAAARVEVSVRLAIENAAKRIARVAFQQIPKHADVAPVPGVLVEQRVEPIERVGCYVPGGRFPLPSSLLMTAVPARV